MSATIDVTGLPAPVVQDIQHLVATLRQTMASNGIAVQNLPPDEWIRRWRAWTASQPRLPIVADDSRESIYEGRGE